MSFSALRIRLIGALGLLLAGPLAAAADEPSVNEISPDGRDACFSRVYDADHLRAHPNQKIQRIFFLYGHDPVSRPNEEPPPHQNASYSGFLATTMRGESKPQWAGAFCRGQDSGDGKSSGVHCGMECDRSMGDLKRDAKGGLLLSGLPEDLYLDAGAQESLSKAEYKRQAFGADDDNFNLAPQPLDVCKAEFARIDPPNPALGAPLRERLKPDQPFCYGRDYDEAHMKGHARQATMSIRVSRGAAEIADYAALPEGERNWADNAEVIVTVTARGAAKSGKQRYSCQGEADQWRCKAFSDDCAHDDSKEIFLRRGLNDGMIIANPQSSLPLVDLCTPESKGATKTDDKIFQLSPMAASACGL
jgi:hypothetical protein